MSRALRSIIVAAALAGCSRNPASRAEPAQTVETIKSPQGVLYTVERVAKFKATNLPSNSDLKMADNDLAKYAQTLCVLDVPPKTAPDRCDVYVQPDRSGTLIGYTAVTQDKSGVSFQTTATLNAEKASTGPGCIFGGALFDGDKSIRNAVRDFDARFMYSAWEKEPGNWLVSPQGPNDKPDDDPNFATGVWYVAKKGDKLHINQERWNACYPSSSDAVVDDVFYRAVTLVRQGATHT